MAMEQVSGVGSNAKRTDLNISKKTTQPMRDDIKSKYYGDTADLNSIQAGADLQGPSYVVPDLPTPGVKVAPSAPVSEPTVALTAETLRPDELPETGMRINKGIPSAGPEVLVATNNQSNKLSDQVYVAKQTDPSRETEDFYNFLIENGL
jgi:hypothetical protein